jgi:hypothetical protein
MSRDAAVGTNATKWVVFRSPMTAVPVMAVPVVAVPVTVMPTPVTTVPAPMVVVSVMSPPVMSPPHFFRCDPIDLVARGHGGMSIFIAGKTSTIGKRLRQQRRGLCARSQRGGSGRKSKGELQKIPAFHGGFLFESGRVMRSEFRCVEMNGR